MRRSIRRGLAALLPFALAACTVEPRPDRAPRETGAEGGRAEAAAPLTIEHLTSPGAASLDLPFSEAVRVGGMLYLAGQVGNRPGEMTVVEGGIQAEARQVMENIRTVLERHGSSMDRVVRCLVMIDDIAEWGAFNEVYVEYFPGPKPARSAFGAEGLALGAAVEVECTALAGTGS